LAMRSRRLTAAIYSLRQLRPRLPAPEGASESALQCKADCAQALSYWETALGFVAGLPGFPAYFFSTLGLNGEPLPVLVLAPAPIDGKTVGPQLERTFEPVCPGAAVPAPGLRLGLGTRLWRLLAKATPGKSVSTHEVTAMEILKLLILRLLYMDVPACPLPSLSRQLDDAIHSASRKRSQQARDRL